MAVNWLMLAGAGGTAPPDLASASHPEGVSAAAWETVSGGTALGVIEAPDYRWVIAAEGNDLDAVGQTLERILAAVPPGAAATPERFEEIYRRDDAVNIAGDDRDVFYARVQVREAVLAPLDTWYNTVHLPEVGAAGLRAGRRFRSLDAERTFLALYRPDTLDVLRSDAINAVRGLGGFENDVEQFARLEARTVARWPDFKDR
jgi:hypothetical protein